MGPKQITAIADPKLPKVHLPRPMLDCWRASERELVSLTKRLITKAKSDAEEAESRGDAKRASLLRTAADFSSGKLQAVTGGIVRGPDAGGELRQALNVLINSIYVEQKG